MKNLIGLYDGTEKVSIGQLFQDQGFHILNAHPRPGYQGRWFTPTPFEWGSHPVGSHLYREGFLATVIKAIAFEGPSDILISKRLNCDRHYVGKVRKSILPLLHRMNRGLPRCLCGRPYSHGGHCIGKFHTNFKNRKRTYDP